MKPTTPSYPCSILLKDGLSFQDDIPKVSSLKIDIEALQSSYLPSGDIIVITKSGAVVYSKETKEVIFQVDLPNIEKFSYSPQGRYLVFWQLIPLQYVQGENGPQKVKQEEKPTLHVFDTKHPKDPIYSVMQKNIQIWPIIQFNINETLMAHLASTVYFYDVSESRITKAEKQYNATVVRNFAWCKSADSPNLFAGFSPENAKKSQPARLFVSNYPNIGSTITSTSFFKAQFSELKWSPKGNLVICKAQTSVDSSGQSYYGESTLHFVSIADSSKNATLPQPTGPVYDAVFNSDGTLMASVAGYMPATVEVFKVLQSGKFISVKKFENQSRNELKFSPNDQFLAVAGFGNCPGEVDVYETTTWKMVSEFEAHCTTEWNWTSDSKSVVFCGCFPRRHFENFIKICNVFNVQEKSVDFGDKLLHLFLKPTPINMDKVEGTTIIGKKKEESQSAYVPPSLRGAKKDCDEYDPMPAPGQKSTRKKHTKKVNKKAKKADDDLYDF
ncbi:eukaryotic translation initiation factor 2A, putative [Entamoeba invadens IP1]|uniref:eukaryotic translation initiation factor 2A, putative n=1 Tax=Entamoeba invadens IP1 TaxID=370355 RepID=UPI0002C3EA8D|nr:eukaryotic translation initiation factor 2A, putative [Entamoeba invadens IP1]ELP93561.1 eukaryotic translation initiation factor 2A, putative [Entamoeba invadens IP1]|eukprot:XP_004260332.1 eukaryotic translation initiation factor 2A, putative [Entamoeba invadens IP1]